MVNHPPGAGARRRFGDDRQHQPAPDAAGKVHIAVQHDFFGGDGGVKLAPTDPDAPHRPDRRFDEEINLEAGIGLAQIDLPALDQQPPAPHLGRGVGIVELQYRPPRWQRRGVDPAAHVPHQHARVPVRAVGGALHPALAPDPHRDDHRRQLRARLGEPVGRGGIVANHPGGLEFLQPLRQQRARHQRHAAMDFVEPRRAADQLAHHQRRPAPRKNFRRFRDRTELPVIDL